MVNSLSMDGTVLGTTVYVCLNFQEACEKRESSSVSYTTTWRVWEINRHHEIVNLPSVVSSSSFMVSLKKKSG